MNDTANNKKTEPALASLLDGVRVLDLTNILSGPYCTYHLVALGADVIKVENPAGGDLARQLGASPALNKKKMGTSFLAQNAGKKSVSLNLKTPEGRELFKKLVATADVLVENFRPGVMTRLGLGYEELKQVNPGLIYCAVSGFGQEGPLSLNPAYDQIIQGMSGVMSVTGDKDTAPLRVGFPLCDTLGGLSAAMAVVSALFARQKSGEGRFIDVSMLDSTLSALGWVVSNYLLAGVEPQAIGNENMTAAPSGTFQAADGPINIAANKQEQFEILCGLIGREDLVNNPLFAEREARKQNRAALSVEINAALKSATAEDWENRFNAAGVPAGRVMSVPEILNHPQITERDLMQSIATGDPELREVKIMRPGYRFSDSLPGVAVSPPTLGEHNASIFAEVGVTEEEISELRERNIV